MHAGRRPGEIRQPLDALLLGNAELSIGLIPEEYKPDSWVLGNRIVAVD
jgi:hypothetical protein